MIPHLQSADRKSPLLCSDHTTIPATLSSLSDAAGDIRYVMIVKENSIEILRDFIAVLVNSGCNSLGPQSSFISDASSHHGTLVPSKCVTEILELKFTGGSLFAPALADVLSSHQKFFGTVSLFICILLTKYEPSL